MIQKIFKNTLKKNPEAKLLRTTAVLTRRDALIVAVGLIFFAVIACATITNSSIWFDEAFSAYIIQFNVAEIFQYTSADVHPPLYYWLLKLWSTMFGTGDIALRSMSVVFAGIAMIFGYLITHRLFGRRAAVLSLGIMIVSPFIVRYSQEMRMYTLVSAIVFAATYVLIRATETRKRKLWLLYGVLISLGMWTHYFAAIAWLAHWVWRATLVERVAKKKTRKQKVAIFFSKDWIVAHVVAIGLFLVWLPFFVKQIVVVQAFGFWIPPISPVTLTNYFTNALFYLDQSSLTPWHTLGFILVVGLLIWLAIRITRRFTATQTSGYSLLLCMVFVPIVLLVLGSMPPLQSSFIDRYLVPSSFALSLLVGVTLALSGTLFRSRIHQMILVGGMVALLGVGVSNVYALGNFNKTTQTASGAKQVMAQIADRSADGDAVIADTVWVYYDTVFYASERYPVFFRDLQSYEYGSLEMLRTQDRNKITSVDDFLRQHDTFWVVGQPGEGDLTPPADGLEVIDSFRQADPITGTPSYQAVRYFVKY